MSQQRSVVRLTSALALSAAACGTGGVAFSGDARAPVREPAGLVTLDVAPAGMQRLGKVKAGCERLEAGAELDGVRLADLACSRELLVAALQDRAASAGGAALVGVQCSAGRRSLDCSAQVWGPPEGTQPQPAPELPVNVDRLAAGAPGAPPRGSVADAWRVFVEAWPRAGVAAGREPSRPESVEELAFPSVAQAPIADVRASCSEGCNVASVREALRLAAAHLGASSVVDIRCIQSGAGASCVGGAAALIAPDARRSEAN